MSKTTYTFKITRDDVLIAQFTGETDELCVYRHMHGNHSYSVNWALENEGFKIEQINEQTKENVFWKFFKPIERYGK